MGLLDMLVGPMLGSLAGLSDEGHEELVKEVGVLLEKEGDLEGLLLRFEQGGLGDQVASWVSEGPNLPLTAEQVTAILDHGEVQAIAQKLGLPAQEVSEHLALLLPQLVDKLTPEGKIPPWGALGGLLGTLE